MAKQRQVSVAGAGFTSISATIPVHYLKIWGDGDRNAAALEYQLPDDNFATTYSTDSSVGDIIERIGNGKYSFLGYPAAFSASGQTPATVLIKLHWADSGTRNVNVYESESAL